MQENLTAHQGEPENNEETIDLEALESESPSDDDEQEDDEGQEPSDEIPELGIANASEEDQKRWEQHWKGVLKREKRVAAKEEELRDVLDNKDRVRGLLQIEQALGSPDSALDVLGRIVSELKRQHGYSDSDVAKTLGLTQAESDDIEFTDDADVYRRAKEDALKEVERKYGQKLKQQETVEAERSERQKLTEFVARNHTKIVNGVSEMAGVKLKFGSGQIEKALLARPALAKEDPAAAVFAEYKGLIKKEVAKAARTGRKGPEVVKSSPRSGTSNKPDSQKSFSELARENGIDPARALKELFE